MERVVIKSPHIAGFTLIEMLIVIVILALFASLGVPSFVDTIRENRLVSQANSLVATLHYARSEAIKRRLPVTVCRSVNGTSCVSGGTPSWETGWIVFIDDNDNNLTDATDGDGQINSTEQLLRVEAALPTSTLRSADANTNNTVMFRNNGLLSNPGGDFNLCNAKTADASKGRNITINVTGKVQTVSPATSCT